ncbi:hypothetical protein D047_4699A, partial [Vibrio parahaemolyticus VPTS-2010_2]
MCIDNLGLHTILVKNRLQIV